MRLRAVFYAGNQLVRGAGARLAQRSLIKEQGGAKDDETCGNQFGFEDPNGVDLARRDKGYDNAYTRSRQAGAGVGSEVILIGIELAVLAPGVLEQSQEHIGGGHELQDDCQIKHGEIRLAYGDAEKAGGD